MLRGGGGESDLGHFGCGGGGDGCCCCCQCCGEGGVKEIYGTLVAVGVVVAVAVVVLVVGGRT